MSTGEGALWALVGRMVMSRWWLGGAGLAALATPVAAQRTGGASPLVDAVVACRTETGEARRLACFDRAAAALGAASGRGELVVLGREDVRRTRRSLFGFNLPDAPLFGGRIKDEPVREIEAVIKGVRGDGYGRYTITLEDGAVWRTTEAGRGTPRPGASVLIRRAALGSYFMSVGGRAGVRALRVG